MLLLGDVFHVSMDVLLKDELTLGVTKEAPHCGHNALQAPRHEIYEGTLIKESIADDRIIDLLHVHKIELWNTGGTPRYWTALFFTSDAQDFPEHLAKVMIADPDRGGNWFADFKAGNQKYIVFRDKILQYRIGNQAEEEYVCAQCRKLGISDAEMNWAE